MGDMQRSPTKPQRQPTHPQHTRSHRIASPSSASPTKSVSSPPAAATTSTPSRVSATPTRSPSRGWTELHLAAARGELDGVRMHFDNAKAAGVVSTAINARDKVLGYTPLHYASYWGHPKVVAFLVGAGADVNLTDNTGGSTPLHLAALCGHVEAVSMLLKAGALVDAKNNDGKTPVDFAATPEVRVALGGTVGSPASSGRAASASPEKKGSSSSSQASHRTSSPPGSKLNNLQEEVAGLRSQLRHAMFSGSVGEDMERLRASLVQDREALQQKRTKSSHLSIDDIVNKYSQRISEIEYVLEKYCDVLKSRETGTDALHAQLEEQRRTHAEETTKLRDALLDAEQARVAMQTRLRKLQKERGSNDVIDTTPQKKFDSPPSGAPGSLVKSNSKQHPDVHVNPDFAQGGGDDAYWRMRQGAASDGLGAASGRSLVSTRTPSAKKEMTGLVGLRLQRNTENQLYISEITPGGAAAAAGNILVGDLVLAVDNQACATSDPEDAKLLIAGPAGGQVELALKRQDKAFTANIVRKAPRAALTNTPHSADRTRRSLATPSPARKSIKSSPTFGNRPQIHVKALSQNFMSLED